MRLSTLLGLDEHPGELAGWGPVHAGLGPRPGPGVHRGAVARRPHRPRRAAGSGRDHPPPPHRLGPQPARGHRGAAATRHAAGQADPRAVRRMGRGHRRAPRAGRPADQCGPRRRSRAAISRSGPTALHPDPRPALPLPALSSTGRRRRYRPHPRARPRRAHRGGQSWRNLPTRSPAQGRGWLAAAPTRTRTSCGSAHSGAATRYAHPRSSNRYRIPRRGHNHPSPTGPQPTTTGKTPPSARTPTSANHQTPEPHREQTRRHSE